MSANQLRTTQAWRLTKRLLADPIRRSYARATRGGRIPIAWLNVRNWGDALNPALVELLAGRPAQLLQGYFYDRFLVVGSILGTADSHAQVWGSGFIREGEQVLDAPRAIHAVRGPLTRGQLLKAGIPCPEIYGDPALLLPHFFNPEVPITHDVGLIPHVVDKQNSWIEEHRNTPGVRVIDVEGDIWDFVRAVKSCRAVLSSSLHGLICADAYGIPNAWIQLSNGLIGGEFKFRDYRLSIGDGEPSALTAAYGPSPLELSLKTQRRTLRIDLELLLKSCPFLADRRANHAAHSLPSRSQTKALFVNPSGEIYGSE
ncbi:MAG: polysaccharide pyruvyl transferase family protein [Steroidobacteraceae bacterium]